MNRTMAASLLAIALAPMLLLAGCASVKPRQAEPKEPEPARKTEAEAPSAQEGCLTGIFMTNEPVNLRAINAFEMQSGKKAGMIMFFMKWGGDFPLKDLEKIVNYGAIPQVTWEPWIGLAPILEGREDAYIHAWARAAKDFGRPFFLRWGHEMNGNWYPWGGANNGKDPEKYISAWKHIADIFRQEGANNAIWVWAPMDNSVPDEEWNDAHYYYPGDEYVDWIGIDGYNWGNTQSWSSWKLFKPIFARFYGDFTSRFPGKPVMIPEFGCADKGGDKAAWIEEAFALMKSDFPQIRAFVWFNISKECDWRVNSSAETLEAYKKMMADPYFVSDPQELNGLLKGFTLPEGASTTLSPFVIEWKKPFTDIKKARGPVTIDGDISEFAGADKITIDSRDFIVTGLDAWKGKDDLSASASLMWDAENLYFAAEVRDDFPLVNGQTGVNVWNGDGIELAFSAKAGIPLDRSSFSPTDFQIAFATGNGKDNKPAAWCWQMGRALEEAEMAVVPAAGFSGYVLEARIPRAPFQAQWKEEDQIQIDVAVNDADESGSRETQLVWSGDDLFYREPAMWGLARFLWE